MVKVRSPKVIKGMLMNCSYHTIVTSLSCFMDQWSEMTENGGKREARNSNYEVSKYAFA